MRWIVIATIIISIVSTFGCATRPFEGWTTENTVGQTIYTVVHAVDWLQTIQVCRSNGEFVELNPILGKTPRESSVHLFMGGTLILQTLIPAMLKPEYRKWYQGTSIGAKGAIVFHNYSVGVRVEF